jgi:hypothetical protein
MDDFIHNHSYGEVRWQDSNIVLSALKFFPPTQVAFCKLVLTLPLILGRPQAKSESFRKLELVWKREVGLWLWEWKGEVMRATLMASLAKIKGKASRLELFLCHFKSPFVPDPEFPISTSSCTWYFEIIVHQVYGLL